MKKCCILIAVFLLLSGCRAEPTFETVDDDYVVPVAATMRQIIIELPREAVTTTMENQEVGTLYLCGDYTVTVQTLNAGDLEGTFRQVSGFDKDTLTVVQTRMGDFDRYDFVWSCAGEGGDQVGKGVIVDDGNYHYVLTAMAEASMAGQLSEEWQVLFDSLVVL